MTASKIEWTERSDWNPIRGCTRVSEGCRNCYAEGIAARFSDPDQSFHGFAERTPKGPRWTGKVELVQDRLTLPLRWRKPATVFASSTSDIFHESLSDADIDRIFAVMALAPQHTFQVLTKRAERMRHWATDPRTPERLARVMLLHYREWSVRWSTLIDGLGNRASEEDPSYARMPLANVWLGVSVEDQAAADARIPHLLATPAAMRFLSCEPLLGPVDLEVAWHGDNALSSDCWGDCAWCSKSADYPPMHNCQRGRQAESEHAKGRSGVDWVIAGGESGPRARPMHPDWSLALRDQCADAGVPFFFKQWGEWAPGECAAATLDRRSVATADWFDGKWNFETIRGDFDFHRDDEPTLYRAGKRHAGRLLDGVEHNGMPG